MPVQSPSWSPTVAAEVSESFRALVHSAWNYLEARLIIARVEGRDALRVGLGVVGLAVAVLLSLTVAYVGAMIALALWITDTSDNGSVLPAIVALIVGHLLLAVLCAWRATRTVRNRRLFHATRKEFMEDQRWLQTNQTFRN